MSTPVRPVAIVTGALRGLGLAAVEALALRGFDLALVDLDEPGTGSDSVMVRLAEMGATGRYYPLDIAQIERHQGLVESVWSDFGRLDCLHNNAGIAARPLTDVLDLDPEHFDRAVDINLRGTFFLSQAVARSMIADSSRHKDEIYRSILVVSSIAAELVSTDRSQYCITKAGLSMTAKVLGVRLGPENIHVHEIRPGFIQTDMTASAATAPIEEQIAQGRLPLPRWGQADDVGRTVASLAAGDIPYSTGQPFWVAGGLNVMQAT